MDFRRGRCERECYMKKIARMVWLLIRLALSLALAGAVALAGLNLYIYASVKGQIVSAAEAAELPEADCILVLGCSVLPDGTPSDMLGDRLRRGIELFEAGAADRLLMSGDHRKGEYDEVNHMKRFAVKAGVPSGQVFMDYAGFSTYESMYRAKEVFQVDTMVIVTQEYHLYRALYDAKAMGITAYGVAADGGQYPGQRDREVRELLARAKDFVYTIIRPEPAKLGEEFPISGNGDDTNGPGYY